MRRPLRLACVLLAAVLLGCGLAGCTAARNGLGTGVSMCFRVLPEAHAAVGKSAIFAGVRRLPGGDLVKAIEAAKKRPLPPDALLHVAHETTCLVAYRDHFTVAGVARGWAATRGPYRAAVVVMDLSTDKVVVTVLFRTVPRSIRFLRRLAFVN